MEPDVLHRLVSPFWLSGHMEQESVLFVQEGDGPPDAPLLFPPSRIESVRSASLETEYTPGRDWTLRGDRLVLLPGSRAFAFARSDLRPKEAPPDAGMFPGRDGQGGVLFCEGAYFHMRQVAVTYRHAGAGWEGPRPGYLGDLLPRSLTLLRDNRRLNLVLFGDSISVGANASGFSGAPPYLPIWGELVRQKLADHYQAEVSFHNPSEGGRGTAWGVVEVEQRVAVEKPDLVILAFGMNDGTLGVEPEVFAGNLVTMMETVRQHNPVAEFVLVAPMLANPESFFAGRQPEFGGVIRSLQRVGVAGVDMGSLHAALLQRKRYVDLTGNHINHPNDFLSRCHAMAVLSALIDFEKEVA